MLFNRQGNYTRVLLDVLAHSYPNRLQVLSSLRAYLSSPQSLCANLNNDSQYILAPSQSLFAHISRCMRPCPGCLGTTVSIPISCGASGACACHPVGEHAGDDTGFYLPPAEQPSPVALLASSSTSSCTTSTMGSDASPDPQ